jgi:LmbE family N-acetylglucosaminyl deacetylase
MRAFEVGQGERVLFAFTHPDDELAVAVFMRRLAQQGTEVRALWTHSTPVREAESRAAMREVGFAQETLTFFDAPDGNVIGSVRKLRDGVCRIVTDFKPTRVVTHAFEQGHIDHDATNLTVNLCYDGPVFEAPYYHTYLTRFPVLYKFSNPQGEEMTDLTEDERRLKKRMTRMYPSQTLRRNVIVYDLLHALTFRRPPLFVSERMRLQTHTDFLCPNHPEPLASRVRASETWQRWEREAEALLTAF